MRRGGGFSRRGGREGEPQQFPSFPPSLNGFRGVETFFREKVSDGTSSKRSEESK
jgi:hypothetical protein